MIVSLAEKAEHEISYFAREDRAVRALAAGESVLLVDEGRIVLMGCAGTATAAQIAFMVRHTSGFLQVALHEDVCDRLLLPEAVPTSRSASFSLGQCVAVDAAVGTTTGISGADRARTARVLSSPTSIADDLTRPGHLVPVRVSPTPHEGHLTIAAVALNLADLALPAHSGAVFADLEGVEDPTRSATVDEALFFARRHGLTTIGSPAYSV